VPDTLAELKDSGRQIAILSNGSPAMLEAVVKSSGLEDLVQTILSVEMVGVFKPDTEIKNISKLLQPADLSQYILDHG
jgi:2-haloacid dehalogenase